MSRYIFAVALLLLACQSDREKAQEALLEAETLETTDPAAAVTRLREAVALDPRLREAFEKLATLELEQGDPAAATSAATSALELRGDDASMQLIVGKGALEQERWDAAEAALVAARELDGSLTEVLPLLARAQAEQEKTDDALATFALAEEGDGAAEALAPAARLLAVQLLDRAEARMDEWAPEEEGAAADADARPAPEPPELREDRRRIRELLAMVDGEVALVARLDALDRRARAGEARREASNAGTLRALLEGGTLGGAFDGALGEPGAMGAFGAGATLDGDLELADDFGSGGLGLVGSGGSGGGGRGTIGLGRLNLGMADSEPADDED